jgi:alginate O-acetyltransferase complex protein AlgI
MLFNSSIFMFVFLPLALFGWWQLRNTRIRLVFLTLASYVFYAWWNWKFVPLMIASTTVDYIAGAKIAESEDPTTRKRWLVCSLTFNLAILGIFKYFGFFASSINEVAHVVGLSATVPVINMVLPIGISFYTFNSMSYTIDIYRRIVKPAPSVLHFSAFVAMFPHLVAGPIVRYSDVDRQFARLKERLSSDQASLGIYFFVIGLAKKLLIADQLAGGVNQYFAGAVHAGAAPSWIGVLGYTFQLYFDFSGYSDMAVGLAHLLGIQFPQNFNSPYKAENISDFWRRWHISLSTWLRDYLFIPLGGSRGTIARTVANLTLTMFLGGLWHGANWTFVIWGLYHGALLALYSVLKQRGFTPKSAVISRLITFLCVMAGWVFFRAETLPKAVAILSSMAGRNGLDLHGVAPVQLAFVLVAALIANYAPNSWEFDLRPRRAYAVGLATLAMLAIMFLSKASPFLYFQF